MQVILEEQSSAIITHALAFDAVRAALQEASEGATIFPVVMAHGEDRRNIFTLKSATTARAAGVKIGSFWPDNPDLGLPRHGTTTILIDQETGRVTAVIEAATVNAYRTAAADAVAASLLARPDSRRLAIFGAGHQAFYECEALARIRPIEEILVVARNPARAEQFCAELGRSGLRARLADARTACSEADIIVTATSATEPLFDAAWVRPGTHVASMGSDGVGKQELPPALFAGARLFADLPAQSRRLGEFQHAPPDSELTAIGDVIAGRAEGRRGPAEITIFDSSGLSVQDIHVAAAILDALGTGCATP